MANVRKGRIAPENAKLQTGKRVEREKSTRTGVGNTNAAKKISTTRFAPSMAKEWESWPNGRFRPSTKS